MSLIQQITELVSANSYLAGPLCLIVAFFGSLLCTNLIVPTGAALTSLGVLVGAGMLSWTIVLWAMCGASAGMSLSYSIGLRLGPSVQRIPLLRTRPELVARTHELFEKYGFISILIAYFFGPLRGTIAAIAAIAGMRRALFELANIASALVWSVFTMGIGIVPGALIERDSIWVLITPILIPIVVMGISFTVMFFRARRYKG